MVTILKVYKKGCAPCERVGAILSQVKVPYVLEELDIEDSKFAVRRKAKGLLGSHGTTNIPLLVFIKEDEKEGYAAHYYEEGDPTVEVIKAKLALGEPPVEILK